MSRTPLKGCRIRHPLAGFRTREDFDMSDIEAKIRAKARELWLAEGQPEGRADAHWLEAEALVRAEAEAEAKPKAPRKPRAPKAEPAEAKAPAKKAAARAEKPATMAKKPAAKKKAAG